MPRAASATAVIVALVLCFGPVTLLLTGAAPGPSDLGPAPLPWSSYLAMLGHSLVVAGGGTLLALVLATPTAFCLFKLRSRLQQILAGCVLAGAATPLYVYASAWIRVLSVPVQDAAVLEPLGSARPLLLACVISGLAKTPLAVLLGGIGLWGLRPELENAAWLDTHRRGVLWHVALRHLARSMLFAASIVFALCLGEIAVTDLVGVRTLAEEAYTQFQLTLNPGAAAVAGLLVFVPLLVPWGIVLAGATRGAGAAEEPVYAEESAVFRGAPRAVRFAARGWVVAALVLVMGVPVWDLLRAVESPGQLARALGLILPEFGYSAVLAVGASALAVAAGFPLVYFTRRSRTGAVVSAIALGGLFVPGAVLGIALVKLLNRGGWPGLVYHHPSVLVLAQFLRFFPLTLLLLWVFLRNVPSQYRDMAVTDGLSRTQALRYVHIPVCARPLLLSFGITWLWCLGEIDASIIVCPPGLTTLPIRIFTMVHYGVYSQVAAACLLLMGVILLAVIAGATAATAIIERPPPRPMPRK